MKSKKSNTATFSQYWKSEGKINQFLIDLMLNLGLVKCAFIVEKLSENKSESTKVILQTTKNIKSLEYQDCKLEMIESSEFKELLERIPIESSEKEFRVNISRYLLRFGIFVFVSDDKINTLLRMLQNKPIEKTNKSMEELKSRSNRSNFYTNGLFEEVPKLLQN